MNEMKGIGLKESEDLYKFSRKSDWIIDKGTDFRELKKQANEWWI